MLARTVLPAWKTTHIKGTVVAQPTKRKFRVQWSIGAEIVGSRAWSSVFQRPAACQFGDSSSTSTQCRYTQNARPALSEQDNEDFGRERDIEELQNVDEADELMLSGEQHVVQISPDVNPLEPHGQKWEVLDAGIPVCQRAAAGLGMNDLRIKWSNQPYSMGFMTSGLMYAGLYMVLFLDGDKDVMGVIRRFVRVVKTTGELALVLKGAGEEVVILEAAGEEMKGPREAVKVAVPSASIAAVMEMLDGVNVSEIFNTVVTAESPDGTSDDAIVAFNCDDALSVCWGMELETVLIRALGVCWGMELETVLIRALGVCWGMELETVLIRALGVCWGMELDTVLIRALGVCWGMELETVLIRALGVCWGMELETVLIRALGVCWGMELETVLIRALGVCWGMELETADQSTRGLLGYGTRNCADQSTRSLLGYGTRNCADQSTKGLLGYGTRNCADQSTKGLLGALGVCWGMELETVLIRALRVCWGMELETVLIRALGVCWGMELETVLIRALRVCWATVHVPWIDAALVFMGAELTGDVIGLILTSVLLDVITWTALPVLVCCTGLFWTIVLVLTATMFCFSVVVSDAVCTFGNGTDTRSLMTCLSMSAGVGLASGIAVYGVVFGCTFNQRGKCENGSFQNQASYAASSSRAQRVASKSAASTWKDLKACRRPRGNSAAGNKARWNKRPSNIDTMKPTKRTQSAIEEAANKEFQSLSEFLPNLPDTDARTLALRMYYLELSESVSPSDAQARSSYHEAKGFAHCLRIQLHSLNAVVEKCL
eukprot:Em0005g1402a